MACMEHFCHVCGHTWFDNFGGGKCPKCLGYNVGHTFDETPDDDCDEPDQED